MDSERDDKDETKRVPVEESAPPTTAIKKLYLEVHLFTLDWFKLVCNYDRIDNQVENLTKRS